MTQYLGLDSSTQSMTGLIIDSDRREIVAEETVRFDDHFRGSYDISNGVIDFGSGVVHSYPLLWIDALELLFDTLNAKGFDLSGIAAVSGSGQQHGTVYLNEQASTRFEDLTSGRGLSAQLTGIFSRPTAPVWMDSSTTTQCREIEQAAGGRDALIELCGNAAFERFSAAQIRKFHQEEPALYDQTTDIALVSSFVASVLAGKIVPVDPADGSGTNLMDIRARQWHTELLDATAPGLADRLAPIGPSGEPAVTIHSYFTGRFGFNADCLVVPFSGDNPCSLIGLGMTEPGQAALSLGTSDTLFACTAEPTASFGGEGNVFASPDDEHYMALTCFMNGSLAREAVRDQHGLNWSEFDAALRSTKPGNDGRLMLPYFDAEIVPVATAGVVRHDLEEHDTAGNVRAVVEAQAISSWIHSRWMGVDVSNLLVTGGASVNAKIAQVYADVHGCPVSRGQTANAAALGAALKAYKAHRPARSWSSIVEPFRVPSAATIEPDLSLRPLYDELIARYRELERG